MSIVIVILAMNALVSIKQNVHAAGGYDTYLAELEWSFDGPFGTYDRAALQRGYKVYRQVCASCHAMDLLFYRNLMEIGYDENQVKAIAGDYTVMDGPNDEGEMYERPARPSDRFVNPYPNRKAATYANNGAYPPDFSLIAEARHGGADYIYSLLTAYEEAPEGKNLLDGQYWNKAMPGYVIAMAPPLYDDIVEYEDGSPQTVQQYSKDLAHFLKWASAPELEERKRIGMMVLIYLSIFAAIMYAVKRKIWADLKNRPLDIITR